MKKLILIIGIVLFGLISYSQGTKNVSSSGGNLVKDTDFSSNGLMKRSSYGIYSIVTDNSTNWNTAYTNRITSLTTTGTSGAATLAANVLNIPIYLNTVGTVTSAGFNDGTGFTISGSPITESGSFTFAQDFSEFTDITESTGIKFVVTDPAEKEIAIGNVDLSNFNNDAGFNSSTGTVTSIATGIGISGGTITASGTIALDFGELGAGGALIATDYLLAENGGVDNRQLISSIPLSIFYNDESWTKNSGTVYSVGIADGIGFDITNSPITTNGNIGYDFDFSEFGDITESTAIKFVVTDPAEKEIAISDIDLSDFNNNIVDIAATVYKTADYTALSTDNVIIYTATEADRTVTLPDLYDGKSLWIRQGAQTHDVIVSSDNLTLNGATNIATYTITGTINSVFCVQEGTGVDSYQWNIIMIGQ